MSQATAEELPRVPRRDPAAEQQIADARVEPTDVEIEAQLQDAQLMRGGGNGKVLDAADRPVTSSFPDAVDGETTTSVIMTIAQKRAYRQLEAAAAAAHRAQNDMASTGAALREAIQALCAAIAPGAK